MGQLHTATKKIIIYADSLCKNLNVFNNPSMYLHMLH